MTKPFKYFIWGLIVDVVSLLALGLYWLVVIALNYKGRCGVFWAFGGDGHPCAFVDYLRQEMGFILLAVVAGLGWLLLPAAALMPVIGYLLGRRRQALKFK